MQGGVGMGRVTGEKDISPAFEGRLWIQRKKQHRGALERGGCEYAFTSDNNFLPRQLSTGEQGYGQG